MSQTRTNLVWPVAAPVALLLLASLSGACSVRGSRQDARKVIVLGIDGMDPQLLRQYLANGRLPNIARLAETGSFRELGTSIPPQSPVAWSNLITGLDPGGHGIFDFIHRDPHTLAPYLSTSRVEASKWNVRLGNWILPLSGGKVTLLRQGRAFWEILDDHGIPGTIFRMPANFPPVRSRFRTFAGMGTPDILGTYGTFSFFTDAPFATGGSVSGGRIYPVTVDGLRVKASLEGPPNPFRKGQPAATVDFSVWLDPDHPAARIDIEGQQVLLQQGEWSEWVPVSFTLVPYLEQVAGICKFYLKQVRPRFELYVTPINIDPARPALPVSTPANYSRELFRELGYFYTQGIAEDTKALTDGVLSQDEYLQQARMVLAEELRAFDFELRRFQAGLLFFYFSSLDQNSHMFWREMDASHPAHDAELGRKFGGVLESLYEEMDRVVGKALGRLDGNTTLLVLSDHGFAPYFRSFNLNTWLLENGYLALKPGGEPQGELFSNVDWSRTRAYGLGLNGLYLNLRGREPHGIVQPGTEARALAAQLAAALRAVRDPRNNLPVITRVDQAAEVYSGPNAAQAPDLLVGYNRGYRASWSTALGGIAPLVLEDNTEPWSGDHCIDSTLVPGVLLSNKKVLPESPRLTDIAPTILAEFSVARPAAMKGRALFENVSNQTALSKGGQHVR